MKSIIKVILISIIIVAILGYAENRTTNNVSVNNRQFGNDTGNLTYDKDSYGFLILNRSLLSYPSYIFTSPKYVEKFRIQATNWSFTNATIIINISHVQNISFNDNKMIIRIFD